MCKVGRPAPGGSGRVLARRASSEACGVAALPGFGPWRGRTYGRILPARTDSSRARRACEVSAARM